MFKSWRITSKFRQAARSGDPMAFLRTWGDSDVAKEAAAVITQADPEFVRKVADAMLDTSFSVRERQRAAHWLMRAIDRRTEIGHDIRVTRALAKATADFDLLVSENAKHALELMSRRSLGIADTLSDELLSMVVRESLSHTKIRETIRATLKLLLSAKKKVRDTVIREILKSEQHIEILRLGLSDLDTVSDVNEECLKLLRSVAARADHYIIRIVLLDSEGRVCRYTADLNEPSPYRGRLKDQLLASQGYVTQMVGLEDFKALDSVPDEAYMSALDEAYMSALILKYDKDVHPVDMKKSKTYTLSPSTCEVGNYRVSGFLAALFHQ